MRSKIRKLLLENSEISAYPWLQYFDTLDSTNNYAMGLIQDGLALHGDVVMANFQSQGKGQRGKVWFTKPGDTIAMSLLIENKVFLDIYQLSFLVPCAVHKAISSYMPSCQVKIKWPNDIYVKDKKLVGILIENVFRGMQINWSVLGIGINVKQTSFDDNLPNAISIFQILDEFIAPLPLVELIRHEVLECAKKPITELQAYYNYHLWKRSLVHTFFDVAKEKYFNGSVDHVNAHFELILKNEMNVLVNKQHGSIQW